jgi:hypothetical protein
MTRTSRNVRRALIALAVILTVACGGTPAYTTTTEYFRSSGGQAAVDDAVLDLVWDDMSLVQRADLCSEVRIAGARGAARIVVSEAPTFSVGQVAEKLEEWCL